MRELLPYLALLIAALSCLISAWVAFRAEKWRNADVVGQLGRDYSDLKSRVDAQEMRIDAQGLILRDLPTKASFAELKGSIDGLEREFTVTMEHVGREMKNAAVAVQRIENHLLERSK